MNTKLIALIAFALASAASSLAGPKAINPEQVDMLLTPYFKMQASLASDDLKAAKQGATSFQAMLKHGDASTLEALNKAATQVAQASDINGAREAFHAISLNLGSLVETVGTSGKSDVFKMHCPMAFGGKGGEWLQSSQETANPYWGARMYGCGSAQSQLASANGHKMSDTQKDSHKHHH